MDLYIPKETLDILSYKSTLGRSLKQKRFKLLINAIPQTCQRYAGVKVWNKSVPYFLLKQYRRPVCGMQGV